jgi:aquaporin Z
VLTVALPTWTQGIVLSRAKVLKTVVLMRSALRQHWPEYLIEGWAMGCLMISVCLLATVFECPKSLIYVLVSSAALRIVLLALGVGMTLTLLIHSPWGKRSGAHMNPAITIAFLRLKKINPVDGLFYMLAQISGGTLGVVIVAAVVRRPFTDPPVHFAATIPGTSGEIGAFAAEAMTSFVLMTMILVFTASPRLIRFTGIAIGFVVAFLIMIEAPLSGASMNPARTLASAIPGAAWQHLWLYLLGPTLGMLGAAQLFDHIHGYRTVGCAKLLHPRNVRCIHCGYAPKSSVDPR